MFCDAFDTDYKLGGQNFHTAELLSSLAGAIFDFDLHLDIAILPTLVGCPFLEPAGRLPMLIQLYIHAHAFYETVRFIIVRRSYKLFPRFMNNLRT